MARTLSIEIDGSTFLCECEVDEGAPATRLDPADPAQVTSIQSMTLNPDGVTPVCFPGTTQPINFINIFEEVGALDYVFNLCQEALDRVDD